MKRISAMVVSAILVLSLLSCTQEGETASKTELNTFSERSSYAIGMDFGRHLKRTSTDIDLPSLIQGLKDILEDRETLLTQEQAAEILQEFSKKMQAQSAQERESLGEANRVEGEAFLAENKTKEGVVTTESGLQYTVLTETDGPKPGPKDRVSVHYRGTLIDGTEFDSSHKRGQPAAFALNAVVAGWTEGLQLMSVGSKYRFFIPSDLAYGERGAGPVIGPNATLIFEVELLAIEE